jgi:hypothetical protein
MNLQPTDVAGIAGAIAIHGPAPNARLNLQLETQAAEESLQTGLYISWVPHPSCILGSSAADEIKNGTGQCCRVGSHSFCRCGHQLSAHKPLGKIKVGYNKPPSCGTCKRCPGFEYSPHFPEECGQWWLSRRKDFVLSDWRKVSPDCTCAKLGILSFNTTSSCSMDAIFCAYSIYSPLIVTSMHNFLVPVLKHRKYATHRKNTAASGANKRYQTTKQCLRVGRRGCPVVPQWMRRTYPLRTFPNSPLVLRS